MSNFTETITHPLPERRGPDLPNSTSTIWEQPEELPATAAVAAASRPASELRNVSSDASALLQTHYASELITDDA